MHEHAPHAAQLKVAQQGLRPFGLKATGKHSTLLPSKHKVPATGLYQLCMTYDQPFLSQIWQ
jgi:hypothetical protein